MAPSVAHLENRAVKGESGIPAASVCPRSHQTHLSEHSWPNLIKIDVEGAENVLKGARHLLAAVSSRDISGDAQRAELHQQCRALLVEDLGADELLALHRGGNTIR